MECSQPQLQNKQPHGRVALKTEEGGGKAHPNVFEIVRVFKMEQAAVDVAVAQLLAGARPPVRSRAAIEKDTKIEELKAKFTNNIISMDSFICGLSGHTNLLA